MTVQVETLKSKCDSETDYKNTINKLESEIDSANNATQSIQAKFDSLSETVEPIKKELKVKDQLISELTKSLSECRLELANMSGFSELKYIADFYENSTGMKVIFQGTSEMQSFKVFNQNVSRTKSIFD